MAETQTRDPHTSPRTAVVWEVLTAELDRQCLSRPPPTAQEPQPGTDLTVVDVGGGTGGFAVPLARAGHRVTVVDASPDALAALTRRAAEAGVPDRITAVQGDGDRLAELVPAGSADLVLCHSLLEVVDEPQAVLQAVAATLRPGGAASVLVASRAGAVLARAMAGHLAAAAAVADEPAHRFDPAGVAELVAGAGLAVAEIHGVRVLAELVPAAVAQAEPEALLALETRLSTRAPYRDIAAQLHVLAHRPAG